MDLKAQLENLKAETFQGSTFIPDVELDNLFTTSTIQDVILEQCCSTISSHEVPQLAETIFKQAKKIFAILVLMGKEYLIKDFIHRRCNDDALTHPVPEEIGDESTRQLFDRIKWQFLAPLFEVGDLHRVLHTKTILPYVKQDHVGSGASATVFKVALHSSHQKLIPVDKTNSKRTPSPSERPQVLVALKEIAKTSAYSNTAFQSERRTLEMIRLVKHPNIVELLATYTFQHKHSMLFPLAQMDLKIFLENKPSAPFDDNRYLFGSMRDLASALDTIHNFTFAGNGLEISELGYHHDIKPRNILVVDNVLKITDFGLSRFKPHEGTMTKTEYHGGDLIYGAPERDAKDPDTGEVKVGRKLDIWSLGCVFLELVSFAVEGPLGVATFRENRKTKHGSLQDSMFCFNFDVKQEVLSWIAHLRMNREDPLVSPILDTIRKMLQGNAEVRPTAIEVREELEMVLQDKSLSKQSISPDAVSDTIQKLHEKNEELLGLINNIVQPTITKSTSADTASGFVDRRVIFFTIQIELYRLSTILDDSSDQATHSKQTEVRKVLKDEVGGSLHFLDKMGGYIDSVLSIKNLECMDGSEELAMRDLEDSAMPFQWHVNRLEGLILPEKSDICQKGLASQLLPGVDDYYKLQIIELACNDHYRILQRSAQLKRRRIEIDQGSLTYGPTLKLEYEHFEIPDDFDRCSACYSVTEEGDATPYGPDSVPVLIEWKRCDPGWSIEECDLISDRVERLAQLLNAKNKPLQALQCIGYIEHCDENSDYVDQYGFVFQLPEDTNPLDMPLSLSDLLAKDTKPYPSLSQRFQLASKLAEHLSALHSVDWLHKGLRSENILFFEKTNVEGVDITVPYLSGFEFSRPDMPGERSIDRGNYDLYLHPDLQPTARLEDYKYSRPRFHRLYDIYSLGLILFEIGFWEKVEVFLPKGNVAPEALRKRIVSKTEDIMGHLMGLRYRNVVLRCLKWDFRAAKDEKMRHGKELLKEFSYMVVKELNRCHCGHSNNR